MTTKKDVTGKPIHGDDEEEEARNRYSRNTSKIIHSLVLLDCSLAVAWAMGI